MRYHCKLLNASFMKPFLLISRLIFLASFCFQLSSCSSPVKEKNDSLYSRHLQRKVDLSIVTTPMPDDKSDMNLFILLSGAGNDQWNMKEMVDSLYEAKAILPLLVVIVEGKSSEEFGLSEMTGQGLPGKKAVQFDKFINQELYAYIKKKTSVRKFSSITIAGAGKAGIGAFDLAWHHDEKFNRVAIFSGAWHDWKRDPADSTAILDYLAQTRKRPKLQYWFYAGEKADTVIAGLTRQVYTKLTAKSFINTADMSVQIDQTGLNDQEAYNHQLAHCLIWAYGKK